ncbi:MAG TPA: PAS domain-containing protein [Chitinophagaceae bacterium]|nr:PAS domain-containing protein [Chitinophagaceae bacterium]
MKQSLKILLLEDSHTDVEMIKRLLLKENKQYEFAVAGDKKSFLSAMDEFFPDIILSDNSLPQFNSLDALRMVRQRFQHIPFILVTGTVSDEYAANMIKEGADDYILKDRMIRLPSAIDAALVKRKMLKEITDYKYALDQSADITITDDKGIIIYANENFCRLSKYSAEELIGRDHRMINSGYHLPSFFKELWLTVGSGKIWQGEVRNKAKDGSFYWVDTTIVPFLDEKGKPYQHLAIRKDISEKKQAEEELLQTQLRFRQAQEIAHLGNWELNFETNESKWSDETYRIYGIEPQAYKVSYEDWLSFVHPDDMEHVKQKIEGSQKTLEDLSFYHRIIRKDGAVRYIYSEAKYEFAKGKPIGLYGISHDVTESKKTEEELRKSNERFHYASQATSDIIWELNFETREYIVHEGGERLFGVNKKVNWSVGIEGKYVVPEDRERIRDSFREARMDPGRQFWENEYRVYSMENTILHITNHAVFIRNEQGKAIRAVGAITDITEKKRLEADLLEREKREQLKLTATTLEAQEKERNAIGQELHDNVNQIIVGTKLLLSIIRENPSKVEELIGLSIKNLQTAIEENRKLAHELVTPDLEMENFGTQIFSLFQKMLKTSGIETNIDLSHFDDKSLSNEQKLAVYRIAQEQCTNIIKYAKATLVNITLHTEKNLFRMIISDNGVGMEEGKKTDGIGLRNINARLSVLNGTSFINTTPGKGFSLIIEMPVNIPIAI